MWSISNITAGSALQIQARMSVICFQIDIGSFLLLGSFLSLHRDARFSLFEIVLFSPFFFQAILDADLLPAAVAALANAAERQDVRNECAWY